MHQPIDDQPENNPGPTPYEDQVAMAWCLVQEGLADFRHNPTTGLYDFSLNDKGRAQVRRAAEEHYGQDDYGQGEL